MATVKESCPKCNSADNLARFDDGHAHCFTPGCGYRERGGGNEGDVHRGDSVGSARATTPLLRGEVEALVNRGITAATCEKWGYVVGRNERGKFHAAQYRSANGGPVIAQKVRRKGKDFTFLGDTKNVPLYGQWLWRDGGKMVVVTEGEIDALSVSQVQGNKWPVVSLPNGAQSAKKSLAKAMDWLLKFEHVVLMFDQDDPGRDAVDAAVTIFPPGRVKVATLPLKDANAMLVAGREKELLDAIWGAKEYRPAGILTIADVREEALKTPEEGLPWAFEGLTKATYGRRYGEVITIGAGTGIGKTDLLTQQMVFDLMELGERVAVISVEQEPSETVKRMAGKHAGKQFHIPGADWNQGELVRSVDALQAQGGLFLFDHWGSADWDTVSNHIRYLAHGEGVRIVYLDHLTAFATGQDEEERVVLENLCAEAAKLAKELRIVLIMVSHLATPVGTPHEEGGHVALRHFKGSRAIGYWTHFALGLERNTMSEDEDEKRITKVKVLKARPCGWKVGTEVDLMYDPETGLLSESTINFEENKL